MIIDMLTDKAAQGKNKGVKERSEAIDSVKAISKSINRISRFTVQKMI